MWTLVNSTWVKLWNTTSKMNEWQHGTVYIGNLLGQLLKGWEVQFEALPDSISLGINDTLAIDVKNLIIIYKSLLLLLLLIYLFLKDISFINCNPNDYLRPLKCDFDIDFCNWMNSPLNTNLNWTRAKASTVSYSTGPSADQY